ncbi:hypothetical protein F2Q68_00020980 [Brassica cretica]|uniref:Uncharacterized protein n=1 Tax=Brassica cretica TaxID=69181 RepID=A0A8S9G321_BRACR|nr:hypothetical protein F2Q68_00020980 [Brassica cretica]
MIPNLWMRIYVLIPKLSSDSVAFIYSSSASVSLSLSSPAHRPSPIRKLYPEADLIVAELLHEIVTGGGGEVVTDGEKSKSGKKGAKAPCAKPLSQYSQMMLNHQKLTQPRITSKITEEQLKASSPGKSQTEDQIQTQEPAVQSQPEG